MYIYILYGNHKKSPLSILIHLRVVNLACLKLILNGDLSCIFVWFEKTQFSVSLMFKHT